MSLQDKINSSFKQVFKKLIKTKYFLLILTWITTKGSPQLEISSQLTDRETQSFK